MVEDRGAGIGHVHLKVAELDRSIRFYKLLGMRLKNRVDGAAFLAFGDYHHHLALNTWHSAGQEAAPESAPGLYHFAIRYGSRRDLAGAVKSALRGGCGIDSTSDCGGVADSVYLRDPDGNGVELTWDRPRHLRPDPMPASDSPLELDDLLRSLETA